MLHHLLFKNRAICATAAMIAMFVISDLAHGGAILFVDDDAPPGGDGTTWKTAYRFLQDALADASGGGIAEIRVGQGTYTPDRDEANPDGTGDREATFQLVNGVALIGGYAGIGAKDPDDRDSDLYETVLSGDLLGDDEPDFVKNDENSYHVVMIVQAAQQPQLDGFTITGGNANDPDELINRIGGGLWNSATDLTISQCRFVENFAILRAGGMSEGGHFTVVLNCRFIGNRTLVQGGAFSCGTNTQVIDTLFESNESGNGGAIFVGFGVDPVFTNCMFRTNVGGNGGGLYVEDTGGPSNVTLIDCIFEGNSSTNGAVHLKVGNSLSATGCLFAGNSGGVIRSISSFVSLDNCVLIGTVGKPAVQIAGPSQTITFVARSSSFIGNSSISNGGAVYIGSSTAVFQNCAFVSNSSATEGGGIYVQSQASLRLLGSTLIGNVADRGGGLFHGSATNPVITNCTLYLNQALVEGGGIFNDPTTSVVANSILWNNFDPGGMDESAQIHGGTPSVSFTCVQGLTGDLGGLGNIDADPLFVDPDNGDFRLSSGSPCIDAGNNWGVPIDGNDYDEDGVLCELFPVDLDGNPRFNADEADFDPGCGVPVVVDMGAYEYQFDPVENVVFADLNADGAVGVKDLLGLLGSWGPCGKGCCLADLDINGSVGVSDLLALLGNWGPCP